MCTVTAICSSMSYILGHGSNFVGYCERVRFVPLERTQGVGYPSAIYEIQEYSHHNVSTGIGMPMT